MRKTIYILTLLGIWSCKNQTTEENIEIINVSNVSNNQHEVIYVKDKSLYDQTFINGLIDYKKPIKLIDNYIITDKDTIYFPNDLKLNKETIFKAEKDDKFISLTVKRTNQTDINYVFKLFDKDNNIIENKSGKAILKSMFFLASEVDEDSETGESYGSSEYIDNSSNCGFLIRIGIGMDDNKKLRANLDYSCKNKDNQKFNFDECPTLRTK